MQGDQATPAGPDQVDAARRRVLVVDDDAGVREVARRLLERSGFAVELAVDGTDALVRFRSNSRDLALVLLDVSMPGMSGNAVLAEMKAIDGSVPVIMMSGFSHLDAQGGQGALPVAAFLQKPFRAATLLDAVNAAIGIDLA